MNNEDTELTAIWDTVQLSCIMSQSAIPEHLVLGSIISFIISHRPNHPYHPRCPPPPSPSLLQLPSLHPYYLIKVNIVPYNAPRPSHEWQKMNMIRQNGRVKPTVPHRAHRSLCRSTEAVFFITKEQRMLTFSNILDQPLWHK